MILESVLSPFIHLFSNKLIEDDRVPVLTFSIPLLDGRYGLLLPKIEFWMQLLMLEMLQAVAAICLGILIYVFIVKHRNTTSSYLMGYGLIIPISLVLPYEFVKVLGLRSRPITMASGTVPTAIVFRCLEAIYGFSPPAVEDTISNYCIYCAAIVELLYDPKLREPIRVSSSKETYDNGCKLMMEIVLFSTLLSLLRPYDFEPFEVEVGPHTLDHGLRDVVLPKHMLNNFIALVLTFFGLSVGIKMVSLATNLLTGIRTIDVMQDPMILSRTPSDFWNRWNRMVQSLLKRGIFKPVRKFFPFAVAVIATFVASGLLHEYVWSFMFYVHDEDRDGVSGQCDNSHSCFYPIHGRQMLLFTWNAFVILTESLVGGWTVFQLVQRHVPQPFLSLLVVMTSIPICHWFTGDWVKGGFFHHFSLGLPVVVKLPFN